MKFPTTPNNNISTLAEWPTSGSRILTSPCKIGNVQSAQSYSANGRHHAANNVHKYSMYDNAPPPPQPQPTPFINNNQGGTLKKQAEKQTKSCEVIENKLAISNDDLLEAIEQLSMLSKPKEICKTSKAVVKKLTAEDKCEQNGKKQMDEEDRQKYIEFLQNEKMHILGNMDALKRTAADIEVQVEEISREVSVFYYNNYPKSV